MDAGNKYLFTIRSLTGGGAERVVSVLASHMAEDDYDVSIIVYDKSNHDYAISNRVKIYYMPTPKKGAMGKIGRIKDMRQLIDSIKPDIIIPFVGTVLFVSYFASRSAKIPFIRTIRNSPWIEEGHGIQKLFRSYLNNEATAIMVQNEEQIDFFPQKLRKKIFVVPNPLSEQVLLKKKENYSDQIRRCITVGRLEEQKNHEALLKAFAVVKKKYPEMVLDIYGTGREFDRLQKLIEELKIEESCHLKGRNDHIEDELVEADLFVMTSKYEGMPNALMEAMAVGLPCLSSDCKTGPRTLIEDNTNGVLYEEGNDTDLIKKWEYLIEHPVECKKYGLEAMKTIRQKYTYEQVYDDLMNMLNKL